MIQFYQYYLKKRLPALVILTVALLISMIIILSQAQFVDYQKIDEGIVRVVGTFNPFLYLSIILGSISIVLPIMEFSFKMKRRSVDLYYALPLKRGKIYIVKYFVGLTELFILFLPQWLLTFIWIAVSDTLYSLSYFLGYLGIAIAAGILLYSFMSFFFTMANSLIDGILFMAMASCALPMGMNILYELLLRVGTSNRMFYMRNFFTPSPLFNLSYQMHYLMCGNVDAALDYYNLLSIILISAICIAAGVAFFFIHTEKNDAEKVSDESDSIFGYKTFIPLFMATAFSIDIINQNYPLWPVVVIVGYLAYSIYRKNFKIKKIDILSLGISVLIGILIGLFI